MKSIQYSKLLLALLIILCFALVGIAIAYRSFYLAGLSFLLGFLLMGFGIFLKRRNATHS